MQPFSLHAKRFSACTTEWLRKAVGERKEREQITQGKLSYTELLDSNSPSEDEAASGVFAALAGAALAGAALAAGFAAGFAAVVLAEFRLLLLSSSSELDGTRAAAAPARAETVAEAAAVD